MNEDIQTPQEEVEDQSPETSEQEPAATPPQTPAEDVPAEEAVVGMDPTEIEEGRTFAILSYALSFIGLPFFLVPMIMRNNEFSLYHSKQSLILWLAGIAGSIVSMILSVICIGVIIGIAVSITCLVLNIIGLINAVHGQPKPLPIIGKWGEDWFKGLTKVQPAKGT